jgi:hypothetical protein
VGGQPVSVKELVTLGYSSRERKRKAKQAVSAARSKHSAKTASRYYLRHVRFDTRCAACGRKLRKGDEMVYRANGRAKLCVPCADADPLVEYRPAAAWEARKRQEIGRRADKARKQATNTREEA